MNRSKVFINKINANKFFTPKKLLLMVFGGALFIAAFVVTFVKLGIDPIKIFTTLGSELNQHPIYSLMLIVLVMFPITRYWCTIVYLKPRMRRMGIEISRLEYFTLFLKTWIINTITPFASGSEPYCIYWMTSRGAQIEDANAISLVNTVLAGFTEIIITIPSFIYISCFYDTIVHAGASGLAIYWMIFAGLCINFIIMFSFFGIGKSKKIHVWISMATNFILRKLKRKYLTKEEIIKKYTVDAAFKNKFTHELREWKLNAKIVICNAICTCMTYCAVFLSLSLLGVVDPTITNSDYIFNITNVAVTANNFIPIPGAEGTLQITIIALANAFGEKITPTGTINPEALVQPIGLWRIFTNYLPLILATFFVCLYYGYKLLVLHFRKMHNIEVTTKYSSLSFVVTVNKYSEDNLRRCLNSILIPSKHKREILIYTRYPEDAVKIKEVLKQKEYKDIKVYHSEGTKTYKIFKEISNNIKNTYMVLVDANDYIHPKYFERISEPLNNQTFDIVAYPQFIINDKQRVNQWKMNNFCKKDNKEYYLSNNYISIFGMLFNKKYIKSHLNYFNDIDIFKSGINRLPNTIIKTDNFMLTNTFFYYHNYENNEIDSVDSLKYYLEVFEATVKDIKNKQVPSYISKYIALEYLILNEKISQNKQIDKETKKELEEELSKIKQDVPFKIRVGFKTMLRFTYSKYRGILP